MLSPKTVDHHVSAVFSEAGCADREAADSRPSASISKMGDRPRQRRGRRSSLGPHRRPINLHEGVGAMWKRVSMIAFLGVLAAAVATPVAARAQVDRVENFETVLAVAMPEDFPVGSLMRADCSSLIRVERPDGSATEIQDCQLSDRPVMIPEFQGTAPRQAFVPCQPTVRVALRLLVPHSRSRRAGRERSLHRDAVRAHPRGVRISGRAARLRVDDAHMPRAARAAATARAGYRRSNG